MSRLTRNNTGYSKNVTGSTAYFVSYRFRKTGRHLSNIAARKLYLNLYEFMDKDDRVLHIHHNLYTMIEFKL